MQYHYAIELGGSFTTIYVKNVGFALKEPTMVAVEKNGDAYTPCAFGIEAKKLLWKTNESVEVFNPISNGSIENYEYLKIMLEHFLAKVGFKKYKKNALVLVPCGLSSKEKSYNSSFFASTRCCCSSSFPALSIAKSFRPSKYSTL